MPKFEDQLAPHVTTCAIGASVSRSDASCPRNKVNQSNSLDKAKPV